MEEFTKSNCPLMSDDVRAFYKAFIPARLKMESAVKAAKGNFGKYADINSIYDACVAPLGEAGIAIWHGEELLADGTELLRTRLIHMESGQWIADNTPLILDKPGNQGRGAARTYVRKEAVKALCALGCEDDDGDVPQPKHDKLINPEMVKQLNEFIGKTTAPLTVLENIKNFNKVTSLEQLKESQVPGVVDHIKRFIKG
jgi:hypothetical protein